MKEKKNVTKSHLLHEALESRKISSGPKIKKNLLMSPAGALIHQE
jgi:hypothetical protein